MSYGPHQCAFALENQCIALHILSAEKIVEVCVELRGGILSLKTGLFVKYPFTLCLRIANRVCLAY
ncbi:unnamed protein product [Penicillium salamii]|nr:unnamed protein product [Penicillium salamii]CAG8394547.1 unnamed protein product [Penicillium salamii]